MYSMLTSGKQGELEMQIAFSQFMNRPIIPLFVSRDLHMVYFNPYEALCSQYYGHVYSPIGNMVVHEHDKVTFITMLVRLI